LKFLIIGGDAAGMSAARRAKRNLPDLKVTVFEQSQDVSCSACGMPYNIADPDRKRNDLVGRNIKEKIQETGKVIIMGTQDLRGYLSP
jgi:NADPH-dependent 2,4-dienoyl-CoA reductase/sulfur reductase-like enzyme